MSNLGRGGLVVILMITVACYRTPVPEQSSFEYYTDAVEARINGNYEQALQSISRAISQNPRIAIFYVFKGQIYDSLQRIDSAIYYYKLSRKFRSQAPEVLKRLGELAMYKGDVNSAFNFWNQAFYQDPSYNVLLLRIADWYYEQGDLNKVETQLDLYRVSCQEYGLLPQPAYYRQKALLSFYQGDTLAAVRYFGKVSGNALDAESVSLALRLFLQCNKLEELFRLLVEVDETRIPANLLHYYRARYYLALENYREAEKLFRRSLQGEQPIVESFLFLARIYCTLGDSTRLADLKHQIPLQQLTKELQRKWQKLLSECK